ncbi:hypothetical protein [Sphingobium sp. Z007]|uniref:hypothetical protein n=1 Tax=Sphingobium sp. Z007 TaxID=627495 RepID=UPI000B49F813|nr:hypothetical protein [Sphingobium sp. Z007]
MSILLPTIHGPSSANMRAVTFGGNQEGALGGPTTAIHRAGDRYAIDVAISVMSHAAAAEWASALEEAISGDAAIAIPQPWLAIGAPGSAVAVDGAGQSGMTLNLKGFPAGYQVGKRQFFHIAHAGKRFVYRARAATLAGGDGRMTLPIWPMLRFLTIDSEGCYFDAPIIEGQLIGGEKGVTMIRARAEPVSISIVERD